jgi:hypothetical protein
LVKSGADPGEVMTSNAQIIAQTKSWITDVVIACNFCPFAAKEVKQNTIRYQVEESIVPKVCIEAFLQECITLDGDEKIETTLLIFPNGFEDFNVYLNLLALAEKSLKRNGYEGMYQVASFHPLYCFAGAENDDAANYTNRSVYPMLHLLREATIEAALARYANHEEIPQQNIDFARKKGITYMKMLRDSCL